MVAFHSVSRRLFVLLSGLLIAGVCAAEGAAPFPAPVEQTAQANITRATLEAPIRVLASDALEGRGPGSRGDELTRLYLSSQLEEMGLKPGGPDGQWLQPVEFVGLKAQFPQTWSFQGKSGSADLAWREDYIASSGQQKDSVSVKGAEVVFVGYGMQAPEYKWDDFKGMNLQGKVLLVMNNDPDWDPKLFAGKRRLYYGRWDYKYETAARQGAAGVIIIHTTESAGYPWQVVQSSWGGEQFELPAGDEPRLQFKAWATEQAVRKLLQSSGYDLDKLIKSAHSRSFKPVALGIKTSIDFTTRLSHVQTGNVAGLLPGSDPKLADQVVVFSAHHDHFGIGEPDSTGDRIYHGALDNASGCAQVLSLARAYAALPAAERPRRSLLFLFVAGEERGLLGSKYYSLHPTFPAGKIAANINIDGGNIFGRTHDITLISAGKASLDAVAESVAKYQGRVVKPDQFPDRGSYYRSDQFSFAKVGVPALFFSDGTDFIGRPPEWGREHLEQWELKQYHQPSDKLDGTWNFDGMIEDAQLVFYSGWIVAQADAMPTWNSGDEFEATRKKALAAVGAAP